MGAATSQFPSTICAHWAPLISCPNEKTSFVENKESDWSSKWLFQFSKERCFPTITSNQLWSRHIFHIYSNNLRKVSVKFVGDVPKWRVTKICVEHVSSEELKLAGKCWKRRQSERKGNGNKNHFLLEFSRQRVQLSLLYYSADQLAKLTFRFPTWATTETTAMPPVVWQRFSTCCPSCSVQILAFCFIPYIFLTRVTTWVQCTC